MVDGHIDPNARIVTTTAVRCEFLRKLSLNVSTWYLVGISATTAEMYSYGICGDYRCLRVRYNNKIFRKASSEKQNVRMNLSAMTLPNE